MKSLLFHQSTFADCFLSVYIISTPCYFIVTEHNFYKRIAFGDDAFLFPFFSTFSNAQTTIILLYFLLSNTKYKLLNQNCKVKREVKKNEKQRERMANKVKSHSFVTYKCIYSWQLYTVISLRRCMTAGTKLNRKKKWKKKCCVTKISFVICLSCFSIYDARKKGRIYVETEYLCDWFS